MRWRRLYDVIARVDRVIAAAMLIKQPGQGCSAGRAYGRIGFIDPTAVNPAI